MRHLFLLVVAAATVIFIPLAGGGSHREFVAPNSSAARQQATSPADLSACPASRGVLTANQLRSGVSVIACGLVGRLVRAPGVGGRIQPPGMALTVHADGPSESSSLTLATAQDGRLSVSAEHLSDDAAVAAADTGCSDNFQPQIPAYEADTHQWRFRTSNMPAGLTASAVTTATTTGSNNIEITNNNCGLGDRATYDQSYLGTTTRAPNISLTGSCDPRDTFNVVGWKYLNDAGDTSTNVKVLAIACTWWSLPLGEIVEADVVFDSDDPWYVSRPTSCGYRFDVQSVMTHERGHGAGMEHVSETDHPWHTMSTSIAACDNSARTLAFGEVFALEDACP
jgi:hypothetical protein